MLAHPNSGDPDALFWPGRHAHLHALDYSQPMRVGAVLRYYLRPAAKRAKLPPRIRFHDLRHLSVAHVRSRAQAAQGQPVDGARVRVPTGGIYARLYPSDYSDNIARFEAFIAEA